MSTIDLWVGAGALVLLAIGMLGLRNEWFGLRAPWVASETGGLGLLVLVSLKWTLEVVNA